MRALIRPPEITRRQLLRLLGVSSFVTGLHTAIPLPAWALAGMQGIGDIQPQRSYDLDIRYAPFTVDGRVGRATAINGTVPGPLLRWREGDRVRMDVTNKMMDTAHTSLHWHGILVPWAMDGIPGLNFEGIRPGDTYRYQFTVKQAGTYWYHSHSAFQEETGAYAALIIDPKGGEPFTYDRDHVVVLSDWSFEDPDTIFRNLHKVEGYYNYQKRTVGDLLRNIEEQGRDQAVAEWMAWEQMRMDPVDILDVTGATYTYLMNGVSPDGNWNAVFDPGETVRLRFINASSMTNFDVRIPGMDMDVVMVDGKAVQPVPVHEFRIGVAETYDVLVRPREDRPYTIFAEAQDRSGYARGTLAPEAGMEAPVPVLRPRPVRSLEDMGMGMMVDMLKARMGPSSPHEMEVEHDHHGEMEHDAPMDHDAMDVDPRQFAGPNGPEAFDPQGSGPNVAMVVPQPRNRLHEPGIGLGQDGWRVLTLADLRNAEEQPYSPWVEREMTIHLTSNMERVMFSLDGRRFREQPGPYRFRHNERLRLFMVNHTMMDHPMHLHGMWMQVENGQDHDHIPFKHTVMVKPGEALSVLITPIERGDWGFHCHLLYHMEAGMFAVVRVA